MLNTDKWHPIVVCVKVLLEWWCTITVVCLLGVGVSLSLCERKKCLHSRAIKWLQCDECDKWYHCIYAHIKPNEANSIDYVCPSCVTVL